MLSRGRDAIHLFHNKLFLCSLNTNSGLASSSPEAKMLFVFFTLNIFLVYLKVAMLCHLARQDAFHLFHNQLFPCSLNSGRASWPMRHEASWLCVIAALCHGSSEQPIINSVCVIKFIN